MDMKKFRAAVAAVLVTALALTGCSSNKKETEAPKETQAPVVEEASEAVSEAAAVAETEAAAAVEAAITEAEAAVETAATEAVEAAEAVETEAAPAVEAVMTEAEEAVAAVETPTHPRCKYARAVAPKPMSFVIAIARSCATLYLLVAIVAILSAAETFPVFATCCNCAFDRANTAPAASASATDNFFVATTCSN